MSERAEMSFHAGLSEESAWIVLAKGVTRKGMTDDGGSGGGGGGGGTEAYHGGTKSGVVPPRVTDKSSQSVGTTCKSRLTASSQGDGQARSEMA